MGKIIAGVDGGGTKTIVELRTDRNAFIIRREYGAANVNSIGEAEFSYLTMKILSDLSKYGKCVSLCIGTAGISNPAVARIIVQSVSKSDYTGRLKMSGDHETALHGAIGHADGMILISGTGSICYGKNGEGKYSRSGGWGHLIDDGGSAYSIARDALSAVVRAYDGRASETKLKELIFEELDIKSPEQLVTQLYSSMDKKAVAALCPLVINAAEQGDEAAVNIVSKNIQELTELVSSVKRKLGLSKAKLCLMGGLLTSSEYVRRLTSQVLSASVSGLEFMEPIADAATGAADLAYENM